MQVHLYCLLSYVHYFLCRERLIAGNGYANVLPDNYQTCTTLEGSFVIASVNEHEQSKLARPLRLNDYPVFPRLREITNFLLVRKAK